MRGLRQESSALVAALVLHAVVFGVVRLTVGDGTPASRWPAPSRPEVSWDVEFGEAPAEASADVGRRAANGVARAARGSHRRTGETPLASVDTETGVVAEVAPAREAEADVATPAKPIDLGLGPDGWQRWVPAPGAEAPRAGRATPRKNRFQLFRAPPVSTTGGLQEGLEARDRELGLGPSGRVLSALHAASHATVAPEVGVARFDVTVHRTGAIEVTLGAASGQVERWKKVAARVARELRAAPPRIPPHREGMKLVVELVAESTLPNGTKANSLIKPHFDSPPLKFQSSEAAIEQVKAENPTTKNPTPDDVVVKLDTPGVYLAERGKVCSYRAGIGSISPGYGLGAAAGPTMQGSCDPMNLDAKPQRMVRTRVVEESMF